MLDDVSRVHELVLKQVRHPDMILLSRQLGGRSSLTHLHELFNPDTAQSVNRDKWPWGTPKLVYAGRYVADHEKSLCTGNNPRDDSSPVNLRGVARRYIAAQRQSSYMTHLERSVLDVTRTQAEQFFNPAEHQARHESIDRSEKETVRFLYKST